MLAAGLSAKLRNEGFEALYDLNGRSFKKQMQYANKIGAKYTCVIGDDECASRTLNIKNMATSGINKANADNIIDDFYSITHADAVSALEDTVL